jgi:hypothetical protein
LEEEEEEKEEGEEEKEEEEEEEDMWSLLDQMPTQSHLVKTNPPSCLQIARPDSVVRLADVVQPDSTLVGVAKELNPLAFPVRVRLAVAPGGRVGVGRHG